MKQWLAAMTVVSLAGAVPGWAQTVVPVQYGGSPDCDACSSQGEVRGLDPNGDNFLAVRTGPGTSHPTIAKLGPRDAVIICEERGPWIGIVYGRGECGTDSPIARRQPYRGPCKSGWVFGKYIAITAG